MLSKIKKHAKQIHKHAKKHKHKVKHAKYGLKILVGALIAAVAIFSIPKIHHKLLKSYVTNKLVYVTNLDGSHGGTGFHVKAKSGKVYIMTNAHVCDGVGKDGNVFVSLENSERPMQRKIIESSVFTDLCLIEPLEGINGLDLASSVESSDIVYSVGHPALYPSTLSSGEIISEQMITIPVSLDTDNCTLPKNKIVTVQTFFGPMDACAIVIRGYLTNIVSMPGSSGSPVVNARGQVIGVIFAGRGDTNWSSLVSLVEVKKMLELR